MFRLRARWPCLETMYKYRPKTRYLPWKYKQNYRKFTDCKFQGRCFTLRYTLFKTYNSFLIAV